MNHQIRKMGLLIAGLLLLTGCSKTDEMYLERIDTEAVTEQETEERKETITETENSLCYVYVCGAVLKEGVYALPEGSRVYEAIELAGGLTEEAAKDGINQALLVEDGQMIQVLTREEAERNPEKVLDGQKEESVSSNGKININTATVEMLMNLPGVGESKARSILAFREDKGRFSSIEEIKNVNGIKDGVYNQIKDKITVD